MLQGIRSEALVPPKFDSEQAVRWLVGLQIFLTYINLVLKVGSLPGISYFFASVCSFLILFTVERPVPRRVWAWLAVLCVTLLLEFAVTLERGSPLGEQLKIEVTQMLLFPSMIGIFVGFENFGYVALRRFCMNAVLTMIAIGVGETRLGLRPVMDWIRELYVSKDSFYAATNRDEILYGALRPTVFAHEPSWVGVYSGFLLLVYVILKPPKRSSFMHLGIASLIFLADIIVVRSPTTIYFFVAAVMSTIVLHARYPRFDAGPYLRAVKIGSAYLLFVVTIAAVILLPFAIYIYANYLDIDILRRIGNSASFLGRVVAPAYIAGESIYLFPVTGIGIAAQKTLLHIAQPIIFFSGGMGALTNPDFAGQYITNGFWEYLVRFGIGFGLLNMVLVSRLLAAMGLRERWLLLLIVVIIWQTVPGVNSQFLWLPVFAVAAALSLRERHEVSWREGVAH